MSTANVIIKEAPNDALGNDNTEKVLFRPFLYGRAFFDFFLGRFEDISELRFLGVIQDVRGVVSGAFEHLKVFHEVHEMEIREAGLLHAKKLARTPSSQVFFRDFEAIFGLDQDIQFIEFFFVTAIVKEVALRARAIAADAATELMKRRQSEMGRLIDQHQIGLLHIDANLDDLGGYEDRA
jgi:hypothetical protein